MAPTLQQLISPELAAAASRIFQGVESAIPVYIHVSGGAVQIGGGSVGPQTINTLSMDTDLLQWMQSVFRRLDDILDLDFELRETSNGSKINIYLDQEIKLGDGSTTLGLALSNEPRRRSWWEVVLNGPPLLRDLSYLHFAFIHELGHVFGLEHPFDNSDGDVGGERFGSPDAATTVMSYTKPPGGWPSFYTDSDLAALVSLWGLEDDQGQSWLIRDATNRINLLPATTASTRLVQQQGGDQLIGVAPAPPPAPVLTPDLTARAITVQGLQAGGQWEVSWTGGRSWTTGGPLPAAAADPLATAESTSRTLLLPGPGPFELVVRQRDRWGQQSATASLTVSAATVGAINVPALTIGQVVLPPDQRQAILSPPAATSSGEPVLFWSLAAELAGDAEVAAAIRRAVAAVDRVIAPDFQEVPAGEAQADQATLVQLRISKANLETSSDEPGQRLGVANSTSNTLVVAGQPMQLQASTTINLDLVAMATAGYPSLAAAVEQVAIHELGHALGLSHPWETARDPALSWASFSQQQTVMAYGSTTGTPATDGLTELDRQALISLHGAEPRPDAPAPTLDITLPQVVLHAPQLKRSASTDTGLSVTTLHWPVQRQGNPSARIQLALRGKSWQASAGTTTERAPETLETLLTLAPGQIEGELQLKLPSGQVDQLNLELLLPATVQAAPLGAEVLAVNVHKLELSLTAEQLIQEAWLPTTPQEPQQRRGLLTRRDSTVFWSLEPALNASWGPTIRALVASIDQACGLQWVEVEAGHPLAQLELVATSTSTVSHGLAVQRKSSSRSVGSLTVQTPERWQVELPSDPLASEAGTGVSAQQALLRWLLQNLGLERPEDSSDGDSYTTTPVYPEDSALFNAMSSLVAADKGARLQAVDRQALERLHGPDRPPTPEESQGSAATSLPNWGLQVGEATSGLRFGRQGPQLQLALEVERQGKTTIESRTLLWASRVNTSGPLPAALQPQEISWRPGEASKTLLLELPLSQGNLELSLQDLQQPAASDGTIATSRLNIRGTELQGLKTVVVPDPITGWSPDLNADGHFEPQLEGQVLLRHALGTFPGASLTAGLGEWRRPTQAPGPLEASAEEQVRAWLLQGQEQGWLPWATPTNPLTASTELTLPIQSLLA